MKNEKIKVLDNGYVQYVDHMGKDLSIVRSARVSYDGKGKSTDEGLINYLRKNKHNTPFESCAVTFEVKLPIFVTRQWNRHRTQSYNEISARYTELPREFYVPYLDQITTQSKDNKQMRTDDQNPNAKEILNRVGANNVDCFDEYDELIELGCPRELARSVLPVGTYTKMFATANLHNWFNFLRERLHPHAQYEIRVYAEAILEMLKELYPIATKSFMRHDLQILTVDDLVELDKFKPDEWVKACKFIHDVWVQNQNEFDPKACFSNWIVTNKVENINTIIIDSVWDFCTIL